LTILTAKSLLIKISKNL